MLLGRPDLKAVWASPHTQLAAASLPALCGLAATALFSSLLLGVVYLTFGSVPGAVACFRGERVSVSPSLADLGSARAGTGHQVIVEVFNWTDAPVRLIGGTTDCSCTVLHDLPLVIAPGDSRSVTVTVQMSGKSGIFTRKAGFVIDDHGMKRLNFRLTGRILDAENETLVHVLNKGDLQ